MAENSPINTNQNIEELENLESLEKRFSDLSTKLAEKKEEYRKDVEEISKIKELISELKKDIEVKEKESLLEENLEKSLSNKEKTIVEEEMKKSSLESFEPKEVKTDIKKYLVNSIVKYFSSGFHTPKKLEPIIKKIRGKALLGTAILSMWVSGGETKSIESSELNYKGPEGKNLLLPTNNKSLLEGMGGKKIENIDSETYESLSPNAQIVYLYSLSNIDSSFVIVDKPRAEMYIIGKDKKMIAQFPILLGKAKGENINMADVDTDEPGPYATTPAGEYRIGQNRDSINQKSFKLYKGKIFSIYGTENLAMHITYPPELEKRTKALNTPSVEDNRLSWGCINVDEKNFDKYIQGKISENAILFVTPDDEQTYFLDPKNGKVEKKIAMVNDHNPN